MTEDSFFGAMPSRRTVSAVTSAGNYSPNRSTVLTMGPADEIYGYVVATTSPHVRSADYHTPAHSRCCNDDWNSRAAHGQFFMDADTGHVMKCTVCMIVVPLWSPSASP